MTAPSGAAVGSGQDDGPAGDRYAVICARRPAAYLGLRTLAAVVAVATASFVVDLLGILVWLVAKVPFLAWWTTGEVGDDVDAAAESQLTLPWPLARLVVLVAGVGVLLVSTHWAARGLPPGRAHMLATVRGRAVWPGPWASWARAAARVYPWLVTAAGIALPLWWFLTQPEDWAYFPLVLVLSLGAAWFFGLTARRGGFWLLQIVPSGLDVTRATVSAAEQRERDLRRARAEQEWPVLPELRLSTAVRVLAAPPSPSRRRTRERSAWWVDGSPATGVEDLATELVVQVLLDAVAAGLVDIEVERSRCRLRPHLPPDRQPAGLAALVLGRHRVGEVLGRTPTVLGPALDAVAGTDPFANVVELALADLEALGVARRDPDSGAWQLSRERLEAAGAPAAGEVAAQVGARDVAHLRRLVRRHLGRRATTEAGSDSGAQQVAYLFVRHAERRRQREYQLPAPF